MAKQGVYFSLAILAAVLLAQTIPWAVAGGASKTAKLDALLEQMGVYDVGLHQAQQFSKILVHTDQRFSSQDKDGTAQKISDRISRETIKEQVLPIWEKNFTAKDIDKIAAFFNSPAGKKFISARRTIGLDSIVAVHGVVKQEFQKTTGFEPNNLK